MLTRQQSHLLDFIGQYMVENRCAPSYDEMKDALGLKSRSGIHRLVLGLEERGFIRRRPFQDRSIEVLRAIEAKPNLRSEIDRILDETANAHPEARSAIIGAKVRIHGALLGEGMQ